MFEPGLTGLSCEIAAEAELGPDVTLGDHCTVGPGAVVRDSALHDGVTVGEGAEVVGSIVGAGRPDRRPVHGVERRTVIGEGTAVRDPDGASRRADGCPPTAGRERH